MTETWRPVPGYEGLYAVSDLGRVRRDGPSRSWRSKPGKMLAPMENTGGYMEVDLYRDGERRRCRVHRLVLLAFHGQPSSYVDARGRDRIMHARHLDGEKANNALSNLVWGTAAANSLDRVAHGTAAGHKLTREQVWAIREDPRPAREVAADHGVDPKIVYKIRTGRTRHTVPRLRRWPS